MANVTARQKSDVDEPASFIQHLAISLEVLACVQLLCEYQVPACIPRNDAIAYSDVADIVGLPEAQLRPVVRMTSSVGFLDTPRAGFMAHSTLSAKFVTDLGVLDAFAFLSEMLAPCALKMAEAIRRDERPYSFAFGGGSDFVAEVQHRWRLQRQANAHFSLAMGNNGEDADTECSNLLAQLEWTSLGNATVVEIDGKSTALAVAIASEHPALSVVVQSKQGLSTEFVPPELASRIRVHSQPANAQPIQDASVYIIRLASPSLTQPARTLFLDRLAGSLATHLPILRENPLARIVLLARVLPELSASTPFDSGTPKVSKQSLASYRDLALQQLTHGRDHERTDVLDCVRGTSDAKGVLVVTNEVRGPDNASMRAFEIQYHMRSPGSTATSVSQ